MLLANQWEEDIPVLPPILARILRRLLRVRPCPLGEWAELRRQGLVPLLVRTGQSQEPCTQIQPEARTRPFMFARVVDRGLPSYNRKKQVGDFAGFLLPRQREATGIPKREGGSYASKQGSAV